LLDGEETAIVQSALAPNLLDEFFEEQTGLLVVSKLLEFFKIQHACPAPVHDVEQLFYLRVSDFDAICLKHGEQFLALESATAVVIEFVEHILHVVLRLQLSFTLQVKAFCFVTAVFSKPRFG
jgi:hypothetical protein